MTDEKFANNLLLFFLLIRSERLIVNTHGMVVAFCRTCDFFSDLTAFGTCGEGQYRIFNTDSAESYEFAS